MYLKVHLDLTRAEYTGLKKPIDPIKATVYETG